MLQDPLFVPNPAKRPFASRPQRRTPHPPSRTITMQAVFCVASAHRNNEKSRTTRLCMPVPRLGLKTNRRNCHNYF